MTELNGFLQPLNAPVTRATEFQNSMDFDSSTDRNTVTFAKIKNFNFNSGFGGTLTLGGTANGNGELYINNASGSLMIWGSRLGLIGYDGQGTAASNIQFWLDTIDTSIYKGSVNIRDASDNASIDLYGLNSINGFVNTDSTSVSLNQAFTGTAETPVTGGTLTVVTNRASNILFLYSSTGYLSGTTAGLNGYIGLFMDGSEVDPARRVHLNTGNLETGASHYIFSAPAAGTYTATLKGVLNSGPGTMTLYSYAVSYAKLGK